MFAALLTIPIGSAFVMPSSTLLVSCKMAASTRRKHGPRQTAQRQGIPKRCSLQGNRVTITNQIRLQLLSTLLLATTRLLTYIEITNRKRFYRRSHINSVHRRHGYSRNLSYSLVETALIGGSISDHRRNWFITRSGHEHLSIDRSIHQRLHLV